jgi:hypothetical protein
VAIILVSLSTIIILYAIDAYRWAGIGAVLVIALTTLTVRRIAADFTTWRFDCRPSPLRRRGAGTCFSLPWAALAALFWGDFPSAWG